VKGDNEVSEQSQRKACEGDETLEEVERPKKNGWVQYDLIACNPPYISDSEIETLADEVKDHEPRLALSGGVDGLDFYRRLADEALYHLRPDGYLVMEIGYDQGETVPAIFEKAYEEIGYAEDEDNFSKERAVFDKAEVLKDLNGLDRVVILKKKVLANQ